MNQMIPWYVYWVMPALDNEEYSHKEAWWPFSEDSDYCRVGQNYEELRESATKLAQQVERDYGGKYAVYFAKLSGVNQCEIISNWEDVSYQVEGSRIGMYT